MNRPNLQYELDRTILNSLPKIILLDLLITLGNYSQKQIDSYFLLLRRRTLDFLIGKNSEEKLKYSNRILISILFNRSNSLPIISISILLRVKVIKSKYWWFCIDSSFSFYLTGIDSLDNMSSSSLEVSHSWKQSFHIQDSNQWVDFFHYR